MLIDLTFLGENTLKLNILPSSPHHLSDVHFKTNGAIDESFCEKSKAIYRGQFSTLEARIFDIYDNVIQVSDNDHYRISISLSDDEGEIVQFVYEDSKILDETFQVSVKINKAGKFNLMITLTSRDNEYHLKEIPKRIKIQ